jgi:hypothetical protein
MVAWTANGQLLRAPLKSGGYVDVEVVDAAGDYSLVRTMTAGAGQEQTIHNSLLEPRSPDA